MRPEKPDIVIVGAGGAGISAALSAAESGLQILVLEKTEWPGGSTRMSGGGIASTGTSFQKEAGITDNKDSWLELWKKRQATSNPDGPYPDYAFVDQFMDQAVNTTEWLAKKQGHSYEKPAGFGQDPEQRIHFPKGTPGGMGGGKQLIANLSATLEKRPNITLLTNTKVTELLLDNGQIKGVKIVDKDGKGEIHASKVIISAGGFVHNTEMIAQYIPAAKTASQFAVGGAGDEGDGILMAQKAGAVLYEDPWVIGMGITAALPETGSLLMDWDKLYVDGHGKRFLNEASHYAVVANAVLSAYEPWIIIDSSKSNEALLKPLADAAAAGRVVKADSIAKLGQQMGLSDNSLTETVTEYNDGAKSGHDSMGKDVKHVIPLTTAPYYAAHIYPVIMGTFGGVKTNEKYEVLDKDGKVIPNLFSTGESANKRLYNHVYMSGSSVQFALTSGRVAGKAAATQLE
ncbi:FAD-dependent oxidoreductase [Ligilactobacillus acidipiscis]|uniref:FAD-dependent oxidoreductase n=1 Tax=Ligilactobacillus acidipiscis TaxID=89059 RepID=UPI0023F93A32|nr:FAD-dependent oxidoreductase [Ligilactobacillus acidipiscis]WEV57064.1 FAD-dependent oxidoreductase [Ligilactobacillus acidipiscis]